MFYSFIISTSHGSYVICAPCLITVNQNFVCKVVKTSTCINLSQMGVSQIHGFKILKIDRVKSRHRKGGTFTKVHIP